ncbi:MAG: oxidoreductase [Candidatus Nanopelagicales bacterium]
MDRTLDLFAPLADLPGVSDAVAESRKAVDTVLWPRNLGSDGPALAVASRVHGAQASAAVDGVDFAIEGWWSGDVWEDSPMGRIAAGVWRGYRELPELVDVWSTAPLQALARLHALVAADVEPVEELGRPRSGELLNDSLRLGPAPSPEQAAARLSLLGRVVGSGSSAPAVVEAAAVHGELLTLRPFQTGSGQLARMSTRLVLAARGLDPDVLTVPEVGIMKLGRPAYVSAARQYAAGTSDGVAAWLVYFAEVVAMGAAAAAEILVGIRAKGLGNSGQEE